MAEYIERETAVRAVMAAKWVDGSDGAMAMEIVASPAAADVAPVRHGQWDGEGDGYADGELVIDVWYCSCCGHCIDDGTDDPTILPNYCPNCGARMDGAGNGEEED